MIGGNAQQSKNLPQRSYVPFIQTVPRRVAAARKEPLWLELERMKRLGVIEKVEELTEWCASCIVVLKKNGKLHVCIDFTCFNAAVRREHQPLPTTEEALSELGNARVFRKLDANCRYWQMELDELFRKLTRLEGIFASGYHLGLVRCQKSFSGKCRRCWWILRGWFAKLSMELRRSSIMQDWKRCFAE